jgi:putative hydrolase of HD superfamily
LARQLDFLLELDRAKSVLRRSYLADASRREDDAEHMWHAAVAAVVLAEHSNEPLDVPRLMTMLLVHDVVEIDAGDTFIYDPGYATSGRAEREKAAAERIFALLPPDQACYFRALWEEFEARETPEAHMAAAIDRLLPVLLARSSGGQAWREHGVSERQVREANSHVREGSAALQEVVDAVISDVVSRGLLPGR